MESERRKIFETLIFVALFVPVLLSSCYTGYAYTSEDNLQANFVWSETCYGAGTCFIDNTTGGTPPYYYRWVFENDGTYELEGEGGEFWRRKYES